MNAGGGEDEDDDGGGDLALFMPEHDIRALLQSTGDDSPAKVIVIGGGPAGLSACIYAARAGLSPVLIAPAFGGQLLGKGVDVENYPGVLGAGE